MITAKAVMLSMVANTMTVVVGRDKSFLDLLASNYAHAFGFENHVSLLNARINDTVNDMISSNFSSSDSQSTYLRYICVTRLLLKQRPVLPILKEVSSSVSTELEQET